MKPFRVREQENEVIRLEYSEGPSQVKASLLPVEILKATIPGCCGDTEKANAYCILSLTAAQSQQKSAGSFGLDPLTSAPCSQAPGAPRASMQSEHVLIYLTVL